MQQSHTERSFQVCPRPHEHKRVVGTGPLIRVCTTGTPTTAVREQLLVDPDCVTGVRLGPRQSVGCNRAGWVGLQDPRPDGSGVRIWTGYWDSPREAAEHLVWLAAAAAVTCTHGDACSGSTGLCGAAMRRVPAPTPCVGADIAPAARPTGSRWKKLLELDLDLSYLSKL